MTRIPPNRRAIHLARRLEQAGWDDTLARDHLIDELTLVDGHKTRTMSDGQPTGSYDPTVDLTPVERVAHRRHLITTTIQQLVDDLDAVEQVVTSFEHTIRTAMRLRVGADTAAELAGVKYCDGTHLAGAHLDWTPYSRDPENGWFDPTCRDIADGDDVLCDRCRPRERRWRDRHALPPRANNTPEPTAPRRDP